MEAEVKETSQKGFHKGLYCLANNKLEKICLEWMILVEHFSKRSQQFNLIV